MFFIEPYANSNMDSCDTRTRAYKNGKTFDQCRQIAETISAQVAKKINETGVVSWTEILETVDHDELVYKLTLKYLRRDGYNIGDWKTTQVTKITV
jgi:phenylpropionate dioxygenase-like ring-hydroxylating dioxygenase large terminal subunit